MIVECLVGQYTHLAVDEGCIDQSSAVGSIAFGERCKNADDRIDAGKDIGDRDARTGRLAVRHAGEAHEAAHALRHQVVAGARRIRTGLAEPGDGAIDEARTFRSEARIVQAELLQSADLEVLQQHVRTGRELAHNALTLRDSKSSSIERLPRLVPWK